MRRLRAVLVFAVLWALAWAPFGALVAYVRRPPWDLIGVPPPSGMMLDIITRGAISWAVFGAINGALFAGLLAFMERRRFVENLTLVRFSIWGALGSLLLPGVVVFTDILVSPSSGSFAILPWVVVATLGAGCAAGTLLVARRAPALPSADRGSLTSA